MSKNGHNALLNYIDDLIYCGLPSTIDSSYQFLLDLLQDLGLDISIKKLCPPDTKVVCLGILFDTVNRTISIPDTKLQEICTVCQNWLVKRMVTKNELQSLLGILLYITKCVKPARYFLNRMLQLLRDNTHNSHIWLTNDFFKDLKWFQVFLSSYNGVTFYYQPQLHKQIFLDTSLEGLGGCYDNLVYALRIPRGFNNYNIAHLKILNVAVALKLWGHAWANKAIQIMCDNIAVVEVLTYGRARDPIMATCARNIWLLSAIFNINIVVSYIKGLENNVADVLSRWHQMTDNLQKLNALIVSAQYGLIHI